MIKPWILAARPQTLPAGLGPVIIGLCLSSQFTQVNTLVAIFTIMTTMLLQISSNLINDYYDGVTGSDTEERLGPTRMVSSGQIKPQVMKKGFLVTLGLAFLLGLYLMFIGGLPIVIIGLSSLFFAWAYTGGPFPLSYYALGEVFALIFFGPVAVWGTFFLQTKSFDHTNVVILWGIAVGLISSAIMGVNNLRDIVQDKAAHKMTIATLMGDKLMRVFILFILIISSVITTFILNKPLLISFVPFAFFAFNWRKLMSDTGVKLNLVLAGTGRYLFLFSVYFGYFILGS